VLSNLFAKRFKELEEECNSFPSRITSGTTISSVPNGLWQKWATSVQNLIKAVFSKDSPQYENFTNLFGKCYGYTDEVVLSQIGKL